jgi:hypothetical protein
MQQESAARTLRNAANYLKGEYHGAAAKGDNDSTQTIYFALLLIYKHYDAMPLFVA